MATSLELPIPGAPLTAKARSLTSRTGVQAALADLALLGGLVVLALLVRWPRLWDVPAFTDEWDEIGVSVALARGEALPLTNVNAILGALPNYLMAAWFWLFGMTVTAPRLFTMVVGALQIVPTYLLARELLLDVGPDRRDQARLAGVAAGLLLASSGAHVVLNSHLAWAISTTPLFTTLALWLLVRARRLHRLSENAHRATAGHASLAAQPSSNGNRGGRALALAGLMFGLALQTHISVIPMLVGAGIGALITLRRLVWTRWSLVAVVLFLGGYANMIVHNLRTGFETLKVAQEKSAGYDGGKNIPYSERLADLGESLFRLLGGAIDGRPTLIAFLTDPFLLLAAGAVLAGLAWLMWRGQSLPLAVVLAVVLIMPFFNNRYEPLLSGRYITPLLPVCFAAASVLLVNAAGRWQGRLGHRRVMSLAFVPVVAISVFSLWQLHGLYTRLESSSRTNVRLWHVLDSLEANRAPNDAVVLDSRLSRRRVIEAGAGDIARVLSGIFRLRGIPYDVQHIEDDWVPKDGRFVVLSGRETPRGIDRLVERHGLRAADGGPAPTPPDLSRTSLYEIYRTAR